MKLRYSHLIRTALGAILSMGLLAACEKGVFMKDTKITTPDFKITTQQPGGEVEEQAAYEIDLKSLMVSDDAIIEGTASWTGLLEFTVTNKTLKQEKRIQLSAKAQMDKVTSGKIETKAGEPVMTWRTKCAGTNCSRYYLVVALHFYDNQGQFQDLRYLVIGWYRDLKQVKRTLLENDVTRVTVDALVQALETMDPALTIPPVAGTGVTAPTGADVSEAPIPAGDSTQSTEVMTVTAPSGVVVGTGTTAPTGEVFSEGPELEEAE